MADLKKWYDEPFADTSAYPSFVVSKLAREKVTVVLTGDGGDELFGGYYRYKAYADAMGDKMIDSNPIGCISRKLGVTETLFAKLGTKYINTGLESYLSTILLPETKSTKVYRKKWGIDQDYDVTWHLKKYYKRELPTITRARYLDLKTYLPGDILTKVDRVSMANSLEARVPFLPEIDRICVFIK